MNYTDYLGNCIAVGDSIVYPTCSGSSAADLNQGVVTEIIPITPEDPADPKNRRGSIPGDAAKPYVRRLIPGRWDPGAAHPMNKIGRVYGDFVRDDSKAYMLRVRRTREGSTQSAIFDPNRVVSLKNVDRVVVITSLVPSS
jgi:hypothetical protein